MSSTDVPDCVLLVILAQVLEISRWNLLTFSAGAAVVCEEALAIVRRVMKTFLGTKTTEGNVTCTVVLRNYNHCVAFAPEDWKWSRFKGHCSGRANVRCCTLRSVRAIQMKTLRVC